MYVEVRLDSKHFNMGVNGDHYVETIKRLEKLSESADLRQAARLWVHAQQESFKKVLEPDGNPQRHQNVIICSLAHYQLFLKMLLKYVHNVWTDKQTNKQTNKQTPSTSLVEVINETDSLAEELVSILMFLCTFLYFNIKNLSRNKSLNMFEECSPCEV